MTHASIPSLKDTGIPWLGQVPEEWTVQPIKHGSYIKARVGWKGLTSDEFEASAYAYLVTGTDFRGQFIDWTSCYQVNEERYLDDPFIQLRDGDLLITKDGTIGKLSLVSGLDKPASLNSGIFLVRPQESYSTRFLYWVLSSRVFEDYVALTSTGSTILHLYQNVFEQFSFGFPSLAAQTSIANFLDRETGQIDDLIVKQERLIGLLAEKRQATIAHAVTKGLDPAAPTKPSGVPWLGEVGAGWTLVELKHVVDVLTGFPFKSEDFSEQPEDVRLLRGVNINPGKTNWADTVRFAESQSRDYADYRLELGDLVLGLDRPLVSDGTRVCAIGKQDLPSLLLQRVARIRTRSHANQEFIGHLLSSSVFANYLEPLFTGVSVPHMSPGQLGEFKIALPPLDEQKDITRGLRITLNKIDVLRDRAERAIRLLRERRSALISAAVTGKIDVQEGAA